MVESVRPIFARGWYGYTDDEIQVALDAILKPESMPKESHIQLEPVKAASPIIDKTLLLAVCIDLVAEQRIRLSRVEAQLDVLSLRLSGLEAGHGSDTGDSGDFSGMEPPGGAEGSLRDPVL